MSSLCPSTPKNASLRFISKARLVHGDFYEYSKVEYVDSRTKVEIVDPVYGAFWQSPAKHLFGQGHPKRGGRQKSTTDEFVQKAREVHGDLYDYSEVEYVNAKTKVKIIDPIYGAFFQTPSDHLRGRGCGARGGTKRLTTDDFIQRSRKVHGDLYDYSRSQYVTNTTKVCIIDPLFGEYWQAPTKHWEGQGHPRRGGLDGHHLDHIVPRSAFVRRGVKSSLLSKLADHPANLRSIPARENVAKSDTIVWNSNIIKGSEVRGDWALLRAICKDLLNLDDCFDKDELKHVISEYEDTSQVCQRSRLGRVAYNDGRNTFKIFDDDPRIAIYGWKKGSLIKPNLGRIKVSNGKQVKLVYPNDIPDGYYQIST